MPKGAKLSLPGNESYQVPADTTLAEVAKEKLGSEDKVTLLFEINSDRLKRSELLPAGTEMKLPQHNLPALIAFAILAVVLISVGCGWLLKTKEEEGKA